MSRAQKSQAPFDSIRGSADVSAEHIRSADIELNVDPDWLASILLDGVAYALPPRIRSVLQGEPTFRKAIQQFGHEKSLWDRCLAVRAVAVQGRTPIMFPFLAGAESPAASISVAAKWPEESRRALQVAERKADEIRERLKGYLGWLVTEPTYLNEVALLRDAWRGLPEDQRPNLPLRRTPRIVDRIPDATPAPEAMARFFAATDALLQKWSLMALITWELPEPLGPQFPDPLPVNSRAVEDAVVSVVLPAHYPLQGSDALLAEIREQQRYLAADQGIPDPVGAMSHYLAYGQMFEVAFSEQILRHRFDHLRIRGFVAILESAIANHLGISVPQVQKHRKAISTCRRGFRHRLPHLKVKG